MMSVLRKVLLFTAAWIIFYNCSIISQVLDDVPVNEWEYFKIYVNAEDDPVFYRLQKELSIDPPLEIFTIVVNIKDTDPKNQYIVMGDEADPSANRYSWSLLSKNVKKKLLNWNRENKEKLTY